MGYAGATYAVQEVCNALFDALFNILPLGSQLDLADPTPVDEPIRWSEEARAALEALVAEKPVLIRISATKTLRDAAERYARRKDLNEVSAECVLAASQQRAAA
jgi:chlorophyllide a reductase subunit Z